MNVRHSVEPEGAASRGRLIPVGRCREPRHAPCADRLPPLRGSVCQHVSDLLRQAVDTERLRDERAPRGHDIRGWVARHQQDLGRRADGLDAVRQFRAPHQGHDDVH